ncbi:MAG: Gfo/Idh/MocA family protein [Spirosomataceae bacterium]
MINVGIIGYGYWGVNLLRNFYNTPNCNIQLVCDQRTERLDLVRKNYPNVGTTTSVDSLLNNKNIDAVIIVTPVSLHYPIAKKALQKGKHILVEKPFTASVKQANELINLAIQKNLVIAIDHTFLFTGAVRKIKNLVEIGELGNIQYFDSTRINLGLFQSDVNVIWDLAPHDISILNHLISEKPQSVMATGRSHTANKIENIAYMSVGYQSNFMAHFTCSWVSPVKIRRILLGGDKKMVLYDDVEPTEKIKIYDSGYQIKTEQEKHRMLIDYRTGDIHLPKIEQIEALSVMSRDFINAVESSSKPFVDGLAGLEVVKILEAAQKSISKGGKEIKL